MAESMLAILCHILRGEPVIQERLAKEREGTVRPDDEAATTTGSVAPSVAPGASSTSGEAPASIGTTSGTSVAGSAAEDSTNSTPRREPQVNQAQLTQVCEKTADQLVPSWFGFLVCFFFHSSHFSVLCILLRLCNPVTTDIKVYAFHLCTFSVLTAISVQKKDLSLVFQGWSPCLTLLH